MKLLTAHLSERMAFPLADSNESYRHLLNSFGRRRLLHEWPAGIRTQWYRARKSDCLPDIGRGFFASDLYAPSRLIGKLFPDPHLDLEFLPFEIDGIEWYVVNPCRRAAGWSRASSDVDSHPAEGTGGDDILSSAHWLTVVDPDPTTLDLFYVDGLLSGAPFFSERFVSRIHALGLKGLDFTVIGEIVRTAALAAPAPPRPPPPPRRDLPSGKGPKLHLEPLSSEEASLIERARATSAGLHADPATIEAEIDALKPLFESQNAAEGARFVEAFQELQVRIGDLIRTRLGWTWHAVARGRSQRFLAVASPDGAFAVSGGAVVLRQLQTGVPSLQLLLNIIQAGQLPHAQADRVTMLQ